MKKIFLFIILGLLAAGVVSAQTVSVPESQVGDITKDVKMLPNVIVKDLKISPAENNKVTGTFVMQNDSSDLLGDLQYNIWLMDPMPELKENEIVQDTSNVYDRFLSTEKISLSPKESRTIDFSYEFPSVPAKEYRLRVRAITSKGMGMGWDEKNFNVAGATNVGFATIFSSEVLPENAKEAATPLSGVNVDPSSKVTLKYVVNNSTNVDLSVTPVLDIYNFDLRGEKVDTVNGDKLTIKGGEKGIKEITFKVPKASTAYFLNLWFKDDSGKRVSSFAEFRVVVKGESGRIVFARFDELNLNMARIEVQAVGPADRESSVQAKITTVLFDGDKEIGKKESSIMNFDNSGAITGYIEFPLTQALANPYVKLTLETVTGKVLDTYELGVKGLTPSKTADVPADVKVISNTLPGKNSPIRIAIAVIVCLLALAVVIYLPFRSKLPIKFFGVLLILAIFGATIFSLNKGAWAANPTPSFGQAQVYYTDGAVWAYVNKPIHEGYEPDKTNIAFNMDIFMIHCLNAGEADEFWIHETKAGGKHGDSTYLNNNSNLVQLAYRDKLHNYGRGSCGGTNLHLPGHPQELCPPAYGIAGRLSSKTASSVTATTLRIFLQKYSWTSGHDPRGAFKAYIFSNFTPPPAPTVSMSANGVNTTSTNPLVINPTGSTSTVSLSWTTTNTQGTSPCAATSIPQTTFKGQRGTTGSENVTLSPSTNYQFNLVCSGEASQTATGHAYVNVSAIQQPNVSLTVNGVDASSTSPLSITPSAGGTSMTLGWTSQNTSGTTPCTLTSTPILTSLAGSKGSSGTLSVNVDPSTNYRVDISCVGQPGTTPGTDSAFVNIEDLPLAPLQCSTLNPVVNSGETAALTAIGGKSPYSWTIPSGSGVLNYSAPGTSAFFKPDNTSGSTTITLKDSNNSQATCSVSVNNTTSIPGTKYTEQ